MAEELALLIEGYGSMPRYPKGKTWPMYYTDAWKNQRNMKKTKRKLNTDNKMIEINNNTFN